MRRSLASFAFVMSGVLAGALIAGCSDDASHATATKPTVDANKNASGKMAAPPRSTNTLPPAEKESTAHDAMTGPKLEMKSPPGATEGEVFVPAVPDEEPAPATKPTTEDRPAAKDDSEQIPTSTSTSSDAAAPKFSTVASADDLIHALNLLVADVAKGVVSEEEYDSQVEKRFNRDGDTIALLATVLGLYDQANPVKPHAAAIVAAARKLADASGYAATKKAVDDLKAAMNGPAAASGELKWDKVSTLEGLMKRQVPYVNKRLKDGLRHFKKRAKDAAANAATMAVIAENTSLYADDTGKPGEAKTWNDRSVQFRSAACEVAAKIHAGDETGANAAMEKLNQSCHACHAVFNPGK